MVYLLNMVIFHGKLLVITRWYDKSLGWYWKWSIHIYPIFPCPWNITMVDDKLLNNQRVISLNAYWDSKNPICSFRGSLWFSGRRPGPKSRLLAMVIMSAISEFTLRTSQDPNSDFGFELEWNWEPHVFWALSQQCWTAGCHSWDRYAAEFSEPIYVDEVRAELVGVEIYQGFWHAKYSIPVAKMMHFGSFWHLKWGCHSDLVGIFVGVLVISGDFWFLAVGFI